ncbi:MAG: hypothetical protein HDR82_09600 [Bacteroides sp.]|nr:hypothetical protein [Bacteroides sp.]
MEEYLFRIVRSVTLTVKHFPFYYAAGLLIFWFLAPALSATTVIMLDSLIVLSALMTLFLIRLSYCVRLCIWHRLQCTLPLLPQLSAHIDSHIWSFGTYTATANTALMILIFTLSLINAYKVFIKPTVRK